MSLNINEDPSAGLPFAMPTVGLPRAMPAPAMRLHLSRILLVEHGAHQARLFGAALQGAGHEVLFATRLDEAMRLAGLTTVGMILVDESIAGVATRDLIAALSDIATAPIIVVADAPAIEEKIAALDAGAHDIVNGNVTVPEFLARVRAAFRCRHARSPAAPVAPIVLGAIEIDQARRRVLVAGEQVDLTPREWSLLVTLAVQRGTIVGRRELLTSIWGHQHATALQYLRVLVGRLRVKLGDAAAELQTIPGVGYRLGPP